MIEIQHGCQKDKTRGVWYYTTVTSPSGQPDDVKYETTPFVVPDGLKPEIGDFIESGVLVKRTKPKVNSDWSKWKDKDLYGNP